jgi:O-antigen/teichoic acid export membrane protein
MKEALLQTLRRTIRNHHIMALSGNVVVSVMSLLSVSLLFRSMGLQEIGMWFFFISTQTFVETFRTGFISTAFIKNYSGAAPGRAAEVLGSAWAIAMAITALLIVVNLLAFLIPFQISNPGVSLFLKWFSITFLVNLPTIMATMVLQAELRFDRILWLRLINQGLFILFIFALFFLDQVSLTRIFYANLAAGAITSAFILVAGWSKINQLGARSRSCVQEICHFGKYSVGTNIGSNLLGNSDTYFITFMLGPAALAVYNLAKRFLEIIEMPLRSFMATGMSDLSVAFNQGKKAEVSRILTKYSGLLTWAFIPVIGGMIVLADIPIRLIGGAKYVDTESANLLRIFMVLTLLLPLDRFIAVTTDVINQPRINMVKTLLQLALNVTGNFLCIYFFNSIYGVALASIPTVVIGFVFGVYSLNKHLPLSLRRILQDSYREGKVLLRRYWARSQRKYHQRKYQVAGIKYQDPKLKAITHDQ